MYLSQYIATNMNNIVILIETGKNVKILNGNVLFRIFFLFSIYINRESALIIKSDSIQNM